MRGPSEYLFQSQWNLSLRLVQSSNVMPRPTVESRNALIKSAQLKAEDIRVQIRKHHQSSLKRGKYEKHSVELEEASQEDSRYFSISPSFQFQKLAHRYVAEVDKILTELKKAK